MKYMMFSIMFIIILLNMIHGTSSLDLEPQIYLEYNTNFSQTVNLQMKFPQILSASPLSLDLKHLFGENGFLKLSQPNIIQGCTMEDNVFIFRNENNQNPFSCSVSVTLTKVYPSKQLFQYSVFFEDNNINFSIDYLKIFTHPNPDHANPSILPIIPSSSLESSLQFRHEPTIDVVSFPGTFFSTFTMSTVKNVYSKEARLELTTLVTLPLVTIKSCLLHYKDPDNASFDFTDTIDFNLIDSKEWIYSFSYKNVQVKITHKLECSVESSSPIRMNQKFYRVAHVFDFPVAPGENSEIGLSFPFSHAIISSKQYTHLDKKYSLTIDTNANRIFYLRNIINYYEGEKTPLFECSDEFYKNTIKLTDDGQSLEIDLRNLLPDAISVRPLTITINAVESEGNPLFPYLSNTNKNVDIIKSMIDYTLVASNNDVLPSKISSQLILATDGSLFLVLNTNIAHFTYDLHLPLEISIRGLDSTGTYNSDYYSLKSATANEVNFGTFPIQSGSNYKLTLFKEQTLPSFPKIARSDNYNHYNDNYILIPISIDLATSDASNAVLTSFLSIRQPNLKSYAEEPIALKKMQLEGGYISRLPFIIPQTAVSLGDRFNVTLNPQLVKHVVNEYITITITTGFHIEYCLIDNEHFNYKELHKGDQKYVLTFQNTGQFVDKHSTPNDALYTIPITCSFYRSIDSFETKLSNPNTVTLNYQSSLRSPYIIKNAPIVPISDEKTKPVFIDNMRSYHFAYYSKTYPSDHKSGMIMNSLPTTGNSISHISTDSYDNSVFPVQSSTKDNVTSEMYISFFRMVFVKFGKYRVDVDDYQKFQFYIGFYSTVFSNVEGEEIIEGDCGNGKVENGSFVFTVTKLGMCQFNYASTSNNDNQKIKIQFLEEVKYSYVNKGDELEENMVNIIPHETSRFTSFPFSEFPPTLTFTSTPLSSDFSMNSKIQFTYISELFRAYGDKMMVLDVGLPSTVSLDIDELSCPQFERIASPFSSKLLWKMNIDRNLQNTGNSVKGKVNTCFLTIKQNLFTSKVQKMSLEFQAPNVLLETEKIVLKNSHVINLNSVEIVDNYSTRRAQLTMSVKSMDIPNEKVNSQYFLVYTDNFNSKPIECILNDSTEKPVVISKIGTEALKYVVIGPLTQESSSTYSIGCTLDIHVKHTTPVMSTVSLLFSEDYNDFKKLVDSNQIVETTIIDYSVNQQEFKLKANTNSVVTTTVSTVLSVLQWNYVPGKLSINQQILEAKKIVAISAKTDISNVFIVEMYYSNTTVSALINEDYDSEYILPPIQHYNYNSGQVQARFGVNNYSFNQEDLLRALNEESKKNTNLNDLSSSVIIDDIVSQCLAQKQGCGALCAPCTGNNNCISDFDCLTNVCSFGKCISFDKDESTGGNGVFDSGYDSYLYPYY